ncbi:4-hydroxyphenylacetate 3-hydroxylase N-terminal domain-containing protein [Streptomyces sp. NRRL B-3229]|uniref:4-hydroxyphenylacetate 3-hydroxylase N-terminal domain-containing protein n=1 Tax=Streptomyces sp. NRRL B-3229 TaxID=1463836 RepID=UPI0004BEA7CD|nr:4-hydroxyphenylacetate 3-hydroxylase N-terminal domain-containing protein [Streptomyces sp. NRRL B-3229]
MAVFAVPVEKPGLRLISRRPYDDGTRNTFDQPLSAHFEEAGSLVVSVEVLVPWGRVFLHGEGGPGQRHAPRDQPAPAQPAPDRSTGA